MAVTEDPALKHWANLLQYLGTAKYEMQGKTNCITSPQKSCNSTTHLKSAYTQSAPAVIDVIFGITADLTVVHCRTPYLVTSVFLYLIS